jgi:glycerol-3-phosphate dehydrogenase subunit C
MEADDRIDRGHEQARALLDNCVKCTVCETQCPVAAATPLFPGPKFVGPQAERYRDGLSVDRSVDYCSSCGICTLVCPQGVHIAELNSQARARMRSEIGIPLRDRIITQTKLEGAILSPVAPVANWALRQKPVRTLVESVVGIHRQAPVPHAQRQTLRSWLRHRRSPRGPFPLGSVVFFHGCAGGYFETETSKRAIEVLEAVGFEVLVPAQGCCGLAEQSNNLFKGARRRVLRLCDELNDAGRELPIVSSAGSCVGMLKHEAREVLGVDDPRLDEVSVRSREFSEFLMDLYAEGKLPVDRFQRMDVTIPYHQPCQVKGQLMGVPAAELMELVPGVHVVESGQPCCGMAGTYGLKREKYDVAQRVGMRVFEHIRTHSQGFGVCDTETCRWQIEKSSGVRMVHPAWVIHEALGLSHDLTCVNESSVGSLSV